MAAPGTSTLFAPYKSKIKVLSGRICNTCNRFRRRPARPKLTVTNLQGMCIAALSASSLSAARSRCEIRVINNNFGGGQRVQKWNVELFSGLRIFGKNIAVMLQKSTASVHGGAQRDHLVRTTECIQHRCYQHQTWDPEARHIRRVFLFWRRSARPELAFRNFLSLCDRFAKAQLWPQRVCDALCLSVMFFRYGFRTVGGQQPMHWQRQGDSLQNQQYLFWSTSGSNCNGLMQPWLHLQHSI